MDSNVKQQLFLSDGYVQNINILKKSLENGEVLIQYCDILETYRNTFYNNNCKIFVHMIR